MSRIGRSKAGSPALAPLIEPDRRRGVKDRGEGPAATFSLEKAVHTTELTESPEINALTNHGIVIHWVSRSVFISSYNSVCSVPSVVLSAGFRFNHARFQWVKISPLYGKAVIS